MIKNRLIYNSLLVVILFFSSIRLFGQEAGEDSILIEGVIRHITGEPVAGASVNTSGDKSEPFVTDSTGQFVLKAPVGEKWLIISSVEHKDKEVFIGRKNYVEIYMAPDDIPSGYDLIQTGYEKQKRRNVISAVDHINLDGEKYRRPYETLGGYLSDEVPGLYAVSHSGMPGAGSYWMLRGSRSIYSNNQPLFVVDGMPLEIPGTIITRIEGNVINPLSSLNPLDIAEVTVLKDAASTALFGVNGSNGVVLINTLNPSATETSIDFLMRTGITMEPSKIPQLGSRQFKLLANEILASSGFYEEEYEVMFPGLYLVPGERGYLPYRHETDWQEEIFDKGSMKEVNLMVKGGDEISRYGLSVGYLNKTGVIKNTGFTRYNIRFTSFLKVYSWLEMNVNANLNNYNASLVPSGLNPQASPVLTALFKSPLLFPYRYDDNGDVLQTIADVKEFGISNPTAVVQKSRSGNTNNRFITSIMLKADLTDHLALNSLAGLNLNSLKEDLFRPENGMADYFNGLVYSYSEENTNDFSSIYTNHYLSYDNLIDDIHNIKASMGFRLQANDLEHDWGRAKNLPANDEFSELQSGDNTLRELGGYTEVWNRFATYANLNYFFKEKYGAMLSASLDFSSRNGKESSKLLNVGKMPLGSFYSFGAAWRISSEPFLAETHWLQNLLLRLSYGVTGNDDIGNVNALDFHRQVRYRETSGLIPGTIPNPGLKHEDSHQLNAGMDLSVAAGRFSLKLDYFTSSTSDLFFYEPLDAYTGFDYHPANGGGIFNRGIEAGFFLRAVQNPAFKWDVKANVNYLDNEVKDLDEPLIISFPGGEYINTSGEKSSSFYGYQYLGVYATSEEAQTANLMNDRGMSFGAGDAKFKDISGPEGVPDGFINDLDKTILGSPVPDLFGNISSIMSYRGFNLALHVDFVLGNEVFNYVRYQNEKMSDLSNQSISVLSRWQKEGDQTDVPRALWNDPIGNSGFSSRWIEDGSFIRLREVTLSFRTPGDFMMLKNAEIFLSAINLITLSEYLSYYPEFSHSNDPMQQGIDYGLMPTGRQFIIGVKLGL